MVVSKNCENKVQKFEEKELIEFYVSSIFSAFPVPENECEFSI